jgi:hypothetical protein
MPMERLFPVGLNLEIATLQPIQLTITGVGPAIQTIYAANPLNTIAESYAYASAGDFPAYTSIISWEVGNWGSGAIYEIGYDGNNYNLNNYDNSKQDWSSYSPIAVGSTFIPQVLSIWASSSASYATLNYANQVSSSINFVPATSCHILLNSNRTTTTYKDQWLRTRFLPPNGVMPSVKGIAIP